MEVGSFPWGQDTSVDGDMLVRAPYGFTFEEDRQGCSLMSRNIPNKGLLEVVVSQILVIFTPKIGEDFPILTTPPKTNMDTQNDGLEKVTPFKNDNFWYLC